MTDITAGVGGGPGQHSRPNLDQGANFITIVLFGGILAAGLLFTAYSLYVDISEAGTPVRTYLPFLLLGVALLIALGFEFVNGFHDTANAVATVIYTHALPANFAVIWAGVFNFLGVLLSTGAVAFGIISLLPVELILQVGSNAGFAMVFALLIAAIIWNHLVSRPAGLLVPHDDRIYHWRRRGQRNLERPQWHLGRRLEQGNRDRLVAASFAALRLRRRGHSPLGAQIRSPQSGPLPGAERQSAAALVDPRPFDPHLHRRLLRAWFE